MKKNYLLLLNLIIPVTVFSQVGINTEAPKTTLDVSVKMNGATLDNSQNYGIQAPRLTRSELASLTSTYGVDQKGALVYITDITGTDTGGTSAQRANIKAVGYYYFDGALWQSIDTSIYKANGSINGENRIVYFNNTSSDNGKLFFTTRNYSPTLPNALLTNGAMLNLIGRDGAGGSTQQDPELGMFMLNGYFGSGIRKEAHLWGGANNSPSSRIQFLAYSSIGSKEQTPDNTSTSKGSTAFLGGKPFSTETMVVDNINLVVRNKFYGSLDVADITSVVPFKINGYGSLLSGSSLSNDDVWRPITTIENTDLYLKNLEHGTTEAPAPLETAGQVLTLIDNPLKTGDLKAVWRNSVNGTYVWNQLATANGATSNSQDIYQSGRVLVGFPTNYTNTADSQTGVSIIGQKFNVADNFGVSRVGSSANMVMFRTNGTFSAPTNSLNNDILGNFLYEGYSDDRRINSSDPNNYGNGRVGVAQVRGISSSNFTSNANSSGSLVFMTKGIGTTLDERMRITDKGYIGIAKSTPTATVDVIGNVTDPALRILNLPTTNDRLVPNNTRSDVNYDKLTPLYVDDKGNVVKGYDPSGPTVSNFDGVYSLPSISSTETITASTGVLITKVNSMTVLNFDVYSGLVLGQVNLGANLLATLSFGAGTGITTSKVSSGTGSTTGVTHPLRIIPVYNAAANIASLDTSITFSFEGTTGSKYDLKFFYVNKHTSSNDSGEIRAVLLHYGSAPAVTQNIQIFNSKRFR